MTNIETLIITYSPILITAFGVLTSFFTVLKAIKNLRASNKQDIDSIKAYTQQIVNDDATLKKQLYKLIDKDGHRNEKNKKI